MKNKFSMTILFCAWLLAAWFMLPQHALADPPKNIALGYDMPTQTLTVTITHKSSFTGIHYIKQVAIKRTTSLPTSRATRRKPARKPSPTRTRFRLHPMMSWRSR